MEGKRGMEGGRRQEAGGGREHMSQYIHVQCLCVVCVHNVYTMYNRTSLTLCGLPNIYTSLCIASDKDVCVYICINHYIHVYTHMMVVYIEPWQHPPC